MTSLDVAEVEDRGLASGQMEFGLRGSVTPSFHQSEKFLEAMRLQSGVGWRGDEKPNSVTWAHLAFGS